MTATDTPQTTLTTRREFLKTSSRALAGAALVAPLATPRPGYAAEDSTIRIALVQRGPSPVNMPALLGKRSPGHQGRFAPGDQ